MPSDRPNARDIAAKGDAVYESKFRPEFERQYPGQFAAIDISTEDAFVGEFAEQALAKARAASPSGIFYLVRVGSKAAFKVSRLSDARPRLV
jgi:hypothetical protein